MVRVKRTGDALGDHMMAAHFVRTLLDHGIDAVYAADHHRELVDVPLDRPGDGQDFYFDYTLNGDPVRPVFDKRRTIFEIVRDSFVTKTKLATTLEIKTPWVPVTFVEQKVSAVDVVLVTKSGVWSRWRDWPRFAELKDAMTKKRIRWIDATEQNVRSHELLNYVDRSKVFVGVETGASHYVSQYARTKGIIVQSGYSWSDYWSPYGYKIVSKYTMCERCFSHLKNGHQCNFDHACMAGIPASRVMGEIERFL